MIIGVGVSWRIAYSIVSYMYLYVKLSGFITSAGEERAIFFCFRLLVHVIMWFLVAEVSSFSWCFN